MVYGVGVNDHLDKVRAKGERLCPYYTRWMSMLQRCYDQGALQRDPSYEGTAVCDEWLIFSNFKSWMQQQVWSGKHLDKDLSGKRLYSPGTCLFISPELNRYWSGARTKGLVGASYEPARGKWKSSIKLPSGGSKTLGRYPTEQEAHDVYMKAKVDNLIYFIETESPPVVKRLLEILEK